MKRIRLLGLSLIAVFAMAAMASSSALASPEFGVCEAQAGGKFLNSSCNKASTPGKEKFELNPVKKNKFTSVIKGTLATLETVGGTKVTCKGESSGGEIKNSKEVGNVVAKFTECSTSSLACKSPTATKEGEIVTSPLGGALGVEKKGTKSPFNDKLAEELKSEKGNVAEFTCAGLPVVVIGSVLHPVTTNKMVSTTVEKFKASKGEQKPDKFAGGPADEHILESNTNGGPFEEAGQTIEATVTFEEKLEANSIGK